MYQDFELSLSINAYIESKISSINLFTINTDCILHFFLTSAVTSTHEDVGLTMKTYEMNVPFVRRSGYIEFVYKSQQPHVHQTQKNITIEGTPRNKEIFRFVSDAPPEFWTGRTQVEPNSGFLRCFRPPSLICRFGERTNLIRTPRRIETD